MGELWSRKLILLSGQLFAQIKVRGGLGVRCLSTLNRAFLFKFSWCFVEEREALWKQVIGWKFGVEQGGWYTRVVKEGFGVGLWKEIRKEGSLLNNIVFSVGNGRRVRF